MKRPSPSKQTLGYIALLGVALTVAIVSGWFATPIDDYAYDWMFRLRAPAAAGSPHCMILAIDDPTYSAMGGVREYRTMLAKALELLAPAQPKVVAVDVVLADTEDPAEDARLERAMRGIRNLVLVAHLSNGRWENPLPRFLANGAVLGHDKADEDSKRWSHAKHPARTAARAPSGTGLWRWKPFDWRVENQLSSRLMICRSEAS